MEKKVTKKYLTLTWNLTFLRRNTYSYTLIIVHYHATFFYCLVYGVCVVSEKPKTKYFLTNFFV